MSYIRNIYAPLWCKSVYSFLEGASHPDELVEEAHRLGLRALALTDRDGVYGIVRAHKKAQELGVRLITGSELTLDDGSRLVLLAMDRSGYANLCRLISIGRLRCPKGLSEVSWEEVCAHAEGLIALWGGAQSRLAGEDDPGAIAGPLRDAFGDRLYALLTRHRERLISRMAAKGIEREFAERVFEQIRGFGEYGFPESHAASFALIAYATAWLKCHRPAAFLCGLLNAQPMGFYSAATLIEDGKRHGVAAAPIDVQRSDWDCTLEPATGSGEGFAVRMGLRYVKGLGAAPGARIVSARAAAPFASLDDCAARARLDRDLLVRLAESGAFESFGNDRRDALWGALAADHAHGDLPLNRDSGAVEKALFSIQRALTRRTRMTKTPMNMNFSRVEGPWQTRKFDFLNSSTATYFRNRLPSASPRSTPSNPSTGTTPSPATARAAIPSARCARNSPARACPTPPPSAR